MRAGFGGRGGVGHLDHEVSRGDVCARSPHPFGLDDVLGVPETGGIDKAHGHPAQLDPDLDRVARRTGHFGDDGDLALRERVHQARLPDVWRPGHSEYEPLTQSLAPPPIIEMAGDVRSHRPKLGQESGLDLRR